MKLTEIVKGFIPVIAMILAFYAGVQAYHNHDQTQSGWMMMCMFSMAITVIGIQLAFDYPGWGGSIIALLCMVCACMFAIHFFGGDQGIRELVRWLSRIYQQISRVYADAFY